MTILEALGMVGDLLPSGKRNNIKILHEEDSVRTTYMIDLTSGYDVLNSLCYYLQQNDVVYVEPICYPRKRKCYNDYLDFYSESFQKNN